MSHPSKAWFVLICLFSYFSMGQSGCQTAPQTDINYVRSDIVHLRRDIASLKEEIKNAPRAPSVNIDGVLRNQAAQREAQLELKDGQQRIESRIEEGNHELATLKQEITNLKLNLIRQMESMRAALKQAQAARPAPKASPRPVASKAPAPVAGASPKVVEPKAPAEPARKPTQPIDYTKLYDTAYEDYQSQNYSLARMGFEEYLRLFPETDLADNSQYWIGECYYAEGKYDDASKAFKMVITRYPTGNKVPRAMLKAGHALLQLGDKEGARSMFQQVIDSYPLSSEADQAKGRLKKLE